jgi:hypothetical protein
MKDTLENLGYVILAVLAFLVMVLLATLILGRIELAWALTKGFLLLWAFLFAEQAIQAFVQRVLRLSELEHWGLVLFNLLLTLVLCLVWSAFVSLEVTRAVADIGWLGIGVLHGLGLIGAWLGFGAITGFFTGTLYRISGLVVSLLGYVVFAIFPNLAQGIFGWFFVLWQ